MSEIKDMVDRQIIYILDVWHNLSKEDTRDIKWRRYFIDQILSIKEIAIVDREAELPKNPHYPRKFIKILDATPDDQVSGEFY